MPPSRRLRVDITTVDAAISDLANTFQFDPSKMTGELTRQAWKALPPSADRVEFSQRLESMSDRALQDDHYDLAVNLDDLAMTASRQSGNNQLVAEVRDRSLRTSEIKAAFIRTQPMIAKLAAAPDDGQANLAVGKFRCFYKGDWDRGLPMMAKGSDAGLATLATADLKTPAGAQDQLAIGDQWWDRGKTQKGVAQENCEGRACYWYGISEPSLSGLEKARIDKRLQTTAALKISRQITVDLIPLVDTNRDAVSGTWEQKDHTLKSDGGDFTRIEFPFDLPEEYDYKVEFERVGGGDCVYVLAAVHNQPFAFILGGMGNHHYGLTGPTEMSTDSVLTNGKRYVCLIKVRRQLISVFVDGKLIQQANAKELQANPNLALRHKNAVGLCTHESPAIFYKAELTQVTGMGHSLETANTR
jgi:hypothetical protein